MTAFAYLPGVHRERVDLGLDPGRVADDDIKRILSGTSLFKDK